MGYEGDEKWETAVEVLSFWWKKKLRKNSNPSLTIASKRIPRPRSTKGLCNILQHLQQTLPGPSAMYDCKVFNYSLFRVNVSINYGILLPRPWLELRFYDFISFSIRYLLFANKLNVLWAPATACKTSSYLLKTRNSKAQRQQWKIIVNYKVIFLFLSLFLC